MSLHRPFGSLSARRITPFASALLMALFATITIQVTPAQAQTPTSGDSISYNGDTYTRLTPTPNDDPTFYSSACGRRKISYAHIANGGGVHVICSDDFNSKPAQYVWFPNAKTDGNQVSSFGDITKQEKDAIIAIQNRYELEGMPRTPADAGEPKNSEIKIPESIQNNAEAYTALYTKFNANVRDQERITLGPENLAGSVSASATGDTITTCDSANTQGIGWIICPVTNWIARGMDVLYNILESFLMVAPISENKPLYYMWGLVRNLANILFIIGFLLIIYSQITNLGISSYGIKRLLPRLVIAAVLVNVSYWVTALAVDLSNILGVALQDAFVEIRNNIPISENINLQPGDLAWQSLAGVILSGGMAGIAIGGAIFGVAVSAGASLFLLLPTLVGVIVAALVAILVLAARQALITILIIVSPLAFVAYLLPSTEKYFERWRSLFMTMLIVFPAFAIVFGGAQLAGMAIISNALEHDDNPNFFNVIILGMIVQIAPIIITPLLVKLSGSLIGRVAGIVNNPNKGIIDGTRKFAEGRRDMYKYGQIANFKDGKLVNNNPLAKAARWKALREADSQHKLKSYQGGTEALYEQTHDAHKVYAQNATSELLKSTGADQSKAEFARETANRDSLRRLYLQQQQTREESEVENKIISTLYEGVKADPASLAANADEREIGDRALKYHITARALDYRGDSAKNIQETESNSAVINNEITINGQGIREFAGFSEIDPLGASRMSSVAQQKEAEAYQRRVGAPQAAQNKVEATQEDLLNIVQGVTPTSSFAEGIRDHADFVEGRAGAVRNIGDSSPVKDIHVLIRKLNLTESATGNEEILRSELAGVGKKGRTIYLSKTMSAQIAEGKIDSALRGDALMNKLIRDTTDSGAFSVTGIAHDIDRDDISELVTYINNGGALNANTIKQIRANLKTVTTDHRFSSTLDKRKKEVGALWDAVGEMPTKPLNLR